MKFTFTPLLNLCLHRRVASPATHFLAIVVSFRIQLTNAALRSQRTDGPVVVAIIGTFLQKNQVVGRRDVGISTFDLQPSLLGCLDSGCLVVFLLQVIACGFRQINILFAIVLLDKKRPYQLCETEPTVANKSPRSRSRWRRGICRSPSCFLWRPENSQKKKAFRFARDLVKSLTRCSLCWLWNGWNVVPTILFIR